MTISAHAKRRMRQRKISREDIDKVLKWGHVFYNDYYRVHCVARTQVQSSRGELPPRLIGLVVVDTRDGLVVTAYRKS